MNKTQEKKFKKLKKKYDVQFMKDNYYALRININKNTESDILEYLNSKSNKQQYIKELIRKDMK